jgi:hypothetical protein
MSDSKKKPKIKKSGIMNIHGKNIVTYEGMLDVAHQLGLTSMAAKLLQHPTVENGNLAIASATAKFSDGREFTDVGDASPDNVPKGCASRFVTMAITRAKGRALSDALNIKNMVDEAGLEISQEYTGDVIDVEYREVKQEALSAAPEVRNGGGSKPATQKQIDLIEMKGKKKSIDHHNYVYNKFGKNLDQLCGSEADAIIKELDKK